jgi:hypothetical protein
MLTFEEVLRFPGIISRHVVELASFRPTAASGEALGKSHGWCQVYCLNCGVVVVGRDLAASDKIARAAPCSDDAKAPYMTGAHRDACSNNLVCRSDYFLTVHTILKVVRYDTNPDLIGGMNVFTLRLAAPDDIPCRIMLRFMRNTFRIRLASSNYCLTAERRKTNGGYSWEQHTLLKTRGGHNDYSLVVATIACIFYRCSLFLLMTI